MTIAFRHENDGLDPDVDDRSCADDGVGWRTYDVSSALAEAGWHDTTVAAERIESGEMLFPVGIFLRDGEAEEEPPVDRYDGDARILTVGFGRGWTTRETVVDTYYDDLRVGEESYDFPVAVPAAVDLDQRGRGGVFGTVELTQDEEGIGVEDVEGDSIGVWPFERVSSMPPTREGADVRGVRVVGDTIEFVVPRSELEGFASGTQPVVVSGAFDVDGTVAAFGEGAELELSR